MSTSLVELWVWINVLDTYFGDVSTMETRGTRCLGNKIFVRETGEDEDVE